MSKVKFEGQLVAACRSSNIQLAIATKRTEGAHWMDTVYVYRPYFCDEHMEIIELQDVKEPKIQSEVKNKSDQTKGRCIVSGDVAVVGQQEGIAREIFVNLETSDSVNVDKECYTIPVNKSDLFVTFYEENGLCVKFVEMNKDMKLSELDYNKLEHITLGKSLLGTPHCIEHQVAFVQTNQKDQMEICVLDTKSKKIVSKTILNIQKGFFLSDIFVHECNSKLCLYFENKNKPAESTAFLWDPCADPTGKKMTTIRSLSEFVQLKPKQVEEDFDRLNVKSVTSDYGSVFSDLNQLEAMFGKEIMETWWGRMRPSSQLGELLIKHGFGGGNSFLVGSTQFNTVYMVDETSRMVYKIKFFSQILQFHLYGKSLYSIVRSI